jgi:HB1, ASXL, restriction endonuclease HTH domain
MTPTRKPAKAKGKASSAGRDPVTTSSPATTGATGAEKAAPGRKAGASRSKQAKAASPPPAGPREGSTMWAVIEVLRGKRTPMRAAEVYAEIRERKLAPGLKGKTPEQTVAAHLAVNAKQGRYVERAEPGKFRLKKGSARATATQKPSMLAERVIDSSDSDHK